MFGPFSFTYSPFPVLFESYGMLYGLKRVILDLITHSSSSHVYSAYYLGGFHPLTALASEYIVFRALLTSLRRANCTQTNMSGLDKAKLHISSSSSLLLCLNKNNHVISRSSQTTRKATSSCQISKDRLVRTEGKKTKLIFFLRTSKANSPIGRLEALFDGLAWG